jgi:hypothetical protein
MKGNKTGTMKRIDLLKKCINDGSIVGEMTLCRAALCCSIRSIEFSATDPKLNPLKDRLQETFQEIGIPAHLIGDVDMVWWDGHMDGILQISDTNELYWHCENEIWIGDPNEGYLKDILKDLVSQNKKAKDIWVFECNDGQTYRLTDPYKGNDEERIEDYGHELGGLELSHIVEVPVYDNDDYDFDFPDEKSTPLEKLKQWLNDEVVND